MTDFKTFEKEIVKAFRRDYPDWQHIKKSQLDICDNGEIFLGQLKFKTDVKLKNFQK